MDWITQNKFRSWLLVVLLASNLVAVSIIWMRTAKTSEPQRKEQGPRPSESVSLMKRVLDLNDEQTKQIENTLAARREQSKKYDDRLADLKMRLAEELFKDRPDSSFADATAREIGELQSKVEMIRFHHFQELLAICAPEQRTKLKPIVIEVFGRKPPKDDPGEKPPPRDGREEKIRGDRNTSDNRTGEPQATSGGRPQPPSVDEKLAKYSDRLNLTGDQEQKIRTILLATRQRGEELRNREDPDQDEIEAEKERIRKEEDERIMNVLNDDQKREFERMISNRKR
jgi:Spy/CpxP family protein refolding chaperone